MRKDKTLESFKIVDDTEFMWKKRRYKVDQIEHLSLDWVNVTERVYGAKAGEYQRICIHVDILKVPEWQVSAIEEGKKHIKHKMIELYFLFGILLLFTRILPAFATLTILIVILEKLLGRW